MVDSKPKKATKKTVATSTKPKASMSNESDAQTTRVLKKQTYKSFRLHKKIKPVQYQLPSTWRLFYRSLMVIRHQWKVFAGIAAVYAVFMILLVRGFGDTLGLDELKTLLNEQFDNNNSQALTATSLFLYMVGGSAGSSGDSSAGVYQLIIFVVASLAVIWALRQAYASKITDTIRIRDSFYRGMTPLVPFLLVSLVIVLELLPVGIGAFLFSTVIQNGIAVEFIEKFLFGAIFAATAVLSLYLVLSTLFAVYVSALPDMTPMRALRSARNLVLHRRLTVLRKILLFMILVFVLIAALMIPVIIFWVTAAEWIFFAITTAIFVLAHGFMYALYRELLND